MSLYFDNLVIIFLLVLVESIPFWLIYNWSKTLNFAQITCFGIAGYSYTILSTRTNLNIWIAIALSIFFGTLANLIVYFISRINQKLDIATFSFILCVFFYFISVNTVTLTNGNLGLINIPPLPFNIFCVLIIILVIEFAVIISLIRSQLGLVSQNLKDTKLLENLGINWEFSRLIIFLVSGVFASIAGILSASYWHYIDPKILNYSFIFTLLAITILTKQNISRIFIYCSLVTLIPELLRVFNLSILSSSEIKNIVFDIIILLAILTSKLKFNSNYVTKN